MLNYNYCWIVVGYISFLRVCCSNYIYKNINRDFEEMDRLKFRVYILSSPALILYISGFNNFNFAIKIEEINRENYFTYKELKEILRMKMKDLCKLSKCSIDYVSLEVEIKKYNIITVCNNNKEIFRKTYRKVPKVLNFWMGNIGPSEKFRSETHLYWKTQLIGCLDELSVNNKTINFEKVFSYFSSSCDNHYKNHILSKTYCSTDLHNFSCSFSKTIKENQVSKSGLSLRNTFHNTFRRIGSNEDFIFLQLTWDHSSTDNYCLMEMKFGSHSVVIQVLQSHLDMVLFNNGEEYERKILHNILKDSINDLSIGLNNSQLMSVKVKDNKFSIECYHSVEEKFESLNIGFVNNKDVCRAFSGKMNFRYNASQLTMQTTRIDVNFSFYLKIFFVVVTLIIIIAIGTFILKLWRIFVSKIPKLNIYEIPAYEDRETYQDEQTYDDGQTYETID